MSIEVVRADYANPDHGTALCMLIDSYASDPMGGSQPLEQDVLDDLMPGLAKQPNAISFIAYDNDEPVGLANCFMGFSTFEALPLLNIHDLIVLSSHRGKGVAKALFGAIEDQARAEKACKVTLEVLSGNGPAKALYSSLGYGDYALDPQMGTALYWQKRLAA